MIGREKSECNAVPPSYVWCECVAKRLARILYLENVLVKFPVLSIVKITENFMIEISMMNT